MKPKAWYCPKCKKFDLADVEESLASPEHIPHRGVDIGCCSGKMIPLYEHEQKKNYISRTAEQIRYDNSSDRY